MSHDNTIGSQPRTDRAGAALRFELESGRFAGQAVLPGERDLARILGVSRTTVRRAMADLVRQGVVGHRRGYGTYVLRRNDESAPEPACPTAAVPIPGPGQELMDQGKATGFRDLVVGVFAPSPEEALVLGLGAGDRVCRASRLWLDRSSMPIGSETCARAFGPGGDGLADPDQWSADMKRQGSEIVRVHRHLRPAGWPSETGSDEPQSTGGILIDQRAFRRDGRCVLLWHFRRRLADFAIGYDVAVPNT